MKKTTKAKVKAFFALVTLIVGVAAFFAIFAHVRTWAMAESAEALAIEVGLGTAAVPFVMAFCFWAGWKFGRGVKTAVEEDGD